MNGLGEILKNERLKKNILLEEIARRTQINERMLIALENNDFNNIPGKFYLHNFLKSYLKAIDIDEQTFFRNHREAIDQVARHQQKEPKLYYNTIRYSRFKRRKLFLGILFLILISVIMTYVVVENKERISSWFSRQPDAGMIPETGLKFNLKTTDVKPDFSPVRLEIESISDCWIQIFRGNRKHSERILKKGEKENIDGYELLINIGNPSSVNLYVNGKELTGFKDSTRPLRLYLTPQNIDSLLAK